MIIALTTDSFFAGNFSKAFGSDKTVCLAGYDELKAKMAVSSDDVVLVDFSTIRPFDLTQLQCNVLVLTGVPKFNEALRLMRFGIRGYGNRAMLPENLVQAASALSAGQVWMPPFIISRLITTLPSDMEETAEEKLDVSERELQVAKYVSEGLSNKEIADKMEITVRTVKAHLTSIFTKTGLRDRMALAIKYKKTAV